MYYLIYRKTGVEIFTSEIEEIRVSNIEESSNKFLSENVYIFLFINIYLPSSTLCVTQFFNSPSHLFKSVYSCVYNRSQETFNFQDLSCCAHTALRF